MVLRMEDLDPDRCRAAYAEQLADDLRWLGLDWDEGYQKGGAHGPYLQSERTAQYAAAFRALEERGLVYPCYCTRAERLAASAPHRSNGQAVYSGKCRHLTAEERTRLGQTRCPAWRLIVPDQEISFTDGLQGLYRENLLRDCGDFILRRSDGVYAYQLAVVCDDGDMGITQVVRGRDLLDSTPRQLYLYGLLGLTPPEFYHVPLLLAPDGRRLSKREHDLDMHFRFRRASSRPRLFQGSEQPLPVRRQESPPGLLLRGPCGSGRMHLPLLCIRRSPDRKSVV